MERRYRKSTALETVKPSENYRVSSKSRTANFGCNHNCQRREENGEDVSSLSAPDESDLLVRSLSRTSRESWRAHLKVFSGESGTRLSVQFCVSVVEWNQSDELTKLNDFLLTIYRVNVACGQAEERVLLTGLHAVADIYCECCKTPLGWKYVSQRRNQHRSTRLTILFSQEHAFESSQKYKEGKYIIELAHMIKENKWDWATRRTTRRNLASIFKISNENICYETRGRVDEVSSTQWWWSS